MASDSNTIRLLFLTSTFILFTFTNAAVSDSDLTFLCSKTDQPSFCQTTLKSDPTWITTTDVHGLSHITLKQATNKANYIPQYLGSVSARAEPELAVKYVACSVDYETVVIPKLTEADTSFKSGNVMTGSQAIVSVLSQIDVCSSRFELAPQDMSQFTSLSLEIQTLCQTFSAAGDLLGGH